MTGVSGSAASREGVDLRALDDAEVLERIAALESRIAMLAAQQFAAVAELARRPARVERAGADPVAVRAGDAPLGRCVRETLPDELAARLCVSTLAASGRVRVACGLATLPVTRGALSRGAIDAARARVIVEETAALDPPTAREVESGVIEAATRLAPARLRSRMRRAVLAADPVAAQDRARRARTERRVVITPTADGMAELWALLPAVQARAIDTVLTRAARARKALIRRGDSNATGDGRHRGDGATMDALRADALAAPFLQALRTGVLDDTFGGDLGGDLGGDVGGQRGGRRAGDSGATQLARRRGEPVQLQVTVAASTLLGRDDEPAELHGYGPIDAATARELARDARWRRILTDPASGAVLDVGTTTYTPTAAIDRHVLARDQRCTFPGCGWPAISCDLDHVIPFPEGPTAVDNLHPLCRRHHRLKQHPAVRVERRTDGTTRWTLPTGDRYDVPPAAVGHPCSGPRVDAGSRTYAGSRTGSGAGADADAEAGIDPSSEDHPEPGPRSGPDPPRPPEQD